MNEQTQRSPPGFKMSASKTSFWNSALVVALVAALVAALLSGIGYIISRIIDRDQTNLRAYIDQPQQVVPLLTEPPKLRGEQVFCEAVRFDVLFSHNQQGAQPIRIKRLKLESVPVSPPESGLDYEVDVLNLAPHGIVQLREYAFAIDGREVDGRYLTSAEAEGAVSVDPRNILDSTLGSEAISLSANGEDAQFQIKCVVETESPGLYRVRLQTAYDVAGEPRDVVTNWIYIYQEE